MSKCPNPSPNARLSERLREVMSGDETPIFLATLDGAGRPNCIPVISFYPYEDDKLIFGEFMLNKTKRNLEADPHVGVAVFSDAFEAWSIKGTFLGFETHGKGFEFVNRTPMFRYNAYTGVRAAGIIRIEEVSDKFSLSKSRMLFDFARGGAAAALTRSAAWARSANGHARCMPPKVEEKFRRLSAIRALAFKDADGFPRAFPLLSCLAAGHARLVASDPVLSAYAPGIAQGGEVAVSVLTPEAVSYQVKGRYSGTRAGVSIIDLTECYNASPPLAGDRLDDAGRDL